MKKSAKASTLIVSSEPDICNNSGCTNEIEQTPGKRPRKYCSDKCRKEAQRKREHTEEMYRESLAEQKMMEQWQTLPDPVVTILKDTKQTFGVWAAWKATQAVMEYKNVTDPVSRKDKRS